MLEKKHQAGEASKREDQEGPMGRGVEMGQNGFVEWHIPNGTMATRGREFQEQNFSSS